MRRFYLLTLAACVAATFSAQSQIQFSEQASALGCGGVTYGSGQLGGGITFFDFDNDGWDDITVTSEAGGLVRFFKNIQGTFTEVFYNVAQESGETKSAVWVDFDNDGDNDLHISSNTQINQLFENDGNMQFTDITVAAGMDLPSHLAWGASWGDFNNDGWLDMFQSSRDVTHADDHNRLYLNNQDGTFTDVTIAAGISTDDYLSFCSSFFDYNNDGWQDIYVANDRNVFANQMWLNNGDGTFTDAGAATGTDIAIDAMSTTIGDDNRDGWFDIYVTNTPAGNAFLRNNGNSTFTDIAAANGTLMETIAWGAVFLDADNDMDLDLYVSSSTVDPLNRLPSAFYENDGSGNYTIPTEAGFDPDVAESYANAIGDIDNDGYPDMVVLNFEPDDIFIWKNECPQVNNWLKVKLEGVQSNRMGIGSVIEISVNGEKQYNYTLCGEGYLSQNSAWEFFGIGDATEIEYIKVDWLSGVQDIINDPQINSHLVIEEGETLGVDDITGADAIRIYPNPARNTVSVSVASGWLESSVTIFDMQGRVLKTQDILNKDVALDISGYDSGVYFLQFTKDGLQITQKLIVQ